MRKIDLASVKNGIVCFTFDDRNFEGWINALPLFEKYNAHASFFISGQIDRTALEAISIFRKNGHTVGLHSVNHFNSVGFLAAYGAEAYFENEIKPQLAFCESHCFAYPNNDRSEETDEFLGKYFDRFRAGVHNASEEQIFIPVNRLAQSRVMRGIGIGEYYNTDVDELLTKFEYIAHTNTCVTFFSHNIIPQAKTINMPTEILEACLEKTSSLGVSVAGFDEI